MFIYIIRNTINNNRYIGKTITSINNRLNHHINESHNENSIGYEFYFHRAIRKYGTDAFVIEHVDDYTNYPITESELLEVETDYIGLYRTYVGFSDCKGYNSTLGGEGCSRYGIKIDVYNKELQFINTYESMESASRELNVHSTNIWSVVNGKMKSIGGYIFCLHNTKPNAFIDEHKVKVDMYSLDGTFIKTFESVKNAAKSINVCLATIVGCCTQDQLTCQGYIFAYHGDDVKLRRLDNRGWRAIDLYDSKTKQFINTFPTITKLINAKLGLGKFIIQRCLRTDNHLAGDYIIVPHGTYLDKDIV